MLLRRLAIAAPVALFIASAAVAETANPDIKGLWLTTPYPVVTLKGGEDTKLPITIVNYNVPPLRADMSLKSVPPGWTVELRGNNRKVGAAFIDVNDKRTFDLDIAAGVFFAYAILEAFPGLVERLKLSAQLFRIVRSDSRATGFCLADQAAQLIGQHWSLSIGRVPTRYC